LIYGSTLKHDETTPDVLHNAVGRLISSIAADASILWRLSYSSHSASHSQKDDTASNITLFAPRPFNIAVEDDLLEPIKQVWDTIVPSNGEEFLRFQERGQDVEEA
jgi:Rab proteins geranylgeranyltransferase component A